MSKKDGREQGVELDGGGGGGVTEPGGGVWGGRAPRGEVSVLGSQHRHDPLQRTGLAAAAQVQDQSAEEGSGRVQAEL